jgi:hypothetical protein
MQTVNGCEASRRGFPLLRGALLFTLTLLGAYPGEAQQGCVTAVDRGCPLITPAVHRPRVIHRSTCGGCALPLPPRPRVHVLVHHTAGCCRIPDDPESYFREPPFHATRRRGPLTAQEELVARTAWKFFENNTQAETGLVNAVDKYPSTTMWDTASYLGALVSAYELHIITQSEFDRRMTQLLKTFNKLEFFRDELPNKAYNTQTGEKVDYTNKPGEIGFSGLDLGRLLVWLKIVKERYPIHSAAVDQFVMRWKFCNVVDSRGLLYGAALAKGQVQYLQEGRLGYEEYGAKGYQLWGFQTALASRANPYDVIPILGVDVPYDTRDPRVFGAHNYVVSESYVLDGIEMGWDLTSDHTSGPHPPSDATTADFAQRIYRVQKNRYIKTGVLTARSEHQLAGDPYFVYDTIYSDGYPWNTITETGKFVPEHSAIALKAAFGLWALWKDDYTDLLFHSVSDENDPQRGFYEGVYENGTGPIGVFTSNNNGIILEELLYKTQGKILRFGGRASLWDSLLHDEFRSNDKCQPRPCAACCNPCQQPIQSQCGTARPNGL